MKQPDVSKYSLLFILDVTVLYEGCENISDLSFIFTFILWCDKFRIYTKRSLLQL
jgi:hypothetical protein